MAHRENLGKKVGRQVLLEVLPENRGKRESRWVFPAALREIRGMRENLQVWPEVLLENRGNWVGWVSDQKVQKGIRGNLEKHYPVEQRESWEKKVGCSRGLEGSWGSWVIVLLRRQVDQGIPERLARHPKSRLFQ